jgi:hypothetical protein
MLRLSSQEQPDLRTPCGRQLGEANGKLPVPVVGASPVGLLVLEKVPEMIFEALRGPVLSPTP